MHFITSGYIRADEIKILLFEQVLFGQSRPNVRLLLMVDLVTSYLCVSLVNLSQSRHIRQYENSYKANLTNIKQRKQRAP